jgi:hypothetical protein
MYFSLRVLKTVKKNIHRGEILKAAVEDAGVSIEVLTRKAGLSRGSYYNHIKKADLDDVILQKYGRAIPYDFSNDIPDLKIQTLSEPDDSAYFTKPQTLDEAIEQRDYYIKKYMELLEDYKRLMEEKLEEEKKKKK